VSSGNVIDVQVPRSRMGTYPLNLVEVFMGLVRRASAKEGRETTAQSVSVANFILKIIEW